MVDEAIAVLVAAFNRGSLDVPSGLFTSRTTFTLNDRTYESILGGSPDDPLIRLLARGVGGYRTAAKTLQYAMHPANVSVQFLPDSGSDRVRLATARIEGRLRDSDERFVTSCSLKLTWTETGLSEVNVTCPEDDLVRIGKARQAPTSYQQ